MKKFENLTFDERKEVVELFGNWLKNYTHEVIVRVMEKRDEILANDFAMNFLRELKNREEKEQEDFNRSIESLMEDFDKYNQYDPHNHPLEHAKSYRDVLYDLYIREA